MRDGLKHVSLLIALLTCFSGAFAQTVLINPATDGGFEQGSTLAANGWTAVNASTDQWVVGAAATASAGTNCAYVSANGGAAWTYSQVSTTTHLYKDITIPAGESKLTVAFKWKARGEGTTTSDWDNMKVFLVPTSVTPTLNVAVNASYQISGPGAVSGMYKLSYTSYNNESILVGVTPGTTYRLVYSWKSDVTTIVSPPAAIDEVSVVSNPAGEFISITTGDWTAPTTWDANSVPTAFDNVTVSTGDVVTINTASQGAGNLTVNGTLTFASAPAAMTVNGNLTVGAAGLFEVFNGTTGKTLNVAGNLTNNGTIDLSKSSSALILNGSNVQTAGGTGTFTSSTITGLTFNNSNAVPTINWNFNNVSVSGTLTFTKGWVNLGSNALILGTSATTLGSLTYTAGGITAGTFGRWVSATSTGSSISSASTPTSTTSRYPFIDATGANRSIWIERVSPSAAGIQAFTYVNGTALSPVTVLDGTYNVSTRYNGNWTFSTLGTSPAAATYKLAITAPGAYTPLTSNSRILLAAAAAAGTHQNGTTAPTAQRIGLTMADLASPFYIGIDIEETVNVSVASGNWNDAATWSKGNVPVCTEPVNISTGHNVTVNAAGAVSKTVSVLTGGTLTIASGDLTVGCTLNNNTLTINGTLAVTGGTLNVNGNINLTSGGTMNQSGGDINVDGNAAGVTANSVASGTRLINLTLAAATNASFTGGTLTIVDPHAATSMTEVLYVNTPYGSVNVTNNHTIRFGNGVSTEAGGNVAGFRVNTWVGNGGMCFGNTIVEGPAGTNRIVTGAFQQPIIGNLTINDGGEYAIGATLLNGNVLVNTGGTFTSTSQLSLTNSVFSPTAVSILLSPSPNAQTITNNGTIRNSATTPTANLAIFNVSNGNATGVTLNSPISVSGTLTLSKGKVNTTVTNLLSLGTATVAGTLAGGADTAYVVGPFARTFAANRTASGTYSAATLFPVGKGASYLPVYADPSTSSAGPVIIRGEAFTSNAGTMPGGVTSLSTNRWEVLPVTGVANLTNSYIRLLDGPAMISTNKILQATTAAGAYGAITPLSNFAAGTPNTLSTATPILAANFKGYFAYGDLTPCVIPTTQPTAFVASNIGAVGFSASFTAATGTPDNYLVVRYPAGATPTDPVDFTAYAVGATIGTTPNDGTVVSISSATSFNQTGLTAGTTYDYYVYSYNNTACFGPVYNVITPLTSSVTTCAAAVGAPGTPVASAISTTGFTVTWTASSTTGATYLLDVATNNTFTAFVPGYNGFNAGTSLTEVITGLTANTPYYVRVRAVDGVCTSPNSSTLTQRTACDIVSVFPWTENFNGVVTPALPPCFSQNNVNNDGDFWQTYIDYGVGGSITAGLYTDFNGGSNNDYLILPQFNLTGSQRLKFSVRARSASEPNDYRVVLSTTGNAPADFTTVLQGITTVSSTTHTQIAPIDLSPYTGNVWIAIHVPSGGLDGYYLYVDDISVENTPAPVITSFTPASFCGTSTTVTITGTELNVATLNVAGTPLTVLTNTGTQITATAPAGVNGPITIVTPGGSVASATNLTISTPPALTVSAATGTICSGASVPVTLTSTESNYDTYTWTPAAGVTGTSSTGYTFNPTVSTTYTLNATQTGGTQCQAFVTYALTVNITPTTMVVTPASAEICEGAIEMLSAQSLLPGPAVSLGSGTSVTTGSTTTNALGPNPFQNYYGGSKQQMLITSAELAGMGMVAGSAIDTLKFEMAFANSSQELNNVKVKLQHTNLTALTTALTTTGWTQVYASATGYTPTAGFNSFPFTTNFEWNGTSNLLVEISYTNNNGGGSATNTAYHGSTPFVSTAFYRVDNATATVLEAAATAGSTYSSRNNLKFSFSRPTPVIWTPVTDLYTDAAATVPYTGTASLSVYVKGQDTRTYSVSLTTTEGCSSTNTIPVVVNPLPVVNAGADVAVCEGTPVTLTATGTTLAATWNNSVVDGVAFTPGTTATYVVSVEDAEGCAGTDTVVVTVNALPTVSAGSDFSACADTEVTLTGSGAATYSWNNSVVNNTPFVPAATATYIVTGTDANNCVNTDTVVVTVNSLPTVNAGADKTVCEGTLVTLSGSGASAYAWNNAVVNGTPFTATVTTTYTVTGTDANGCIGTDQVVVNVNAAPVATATLTNQVTITASPATGVTYQWINCANNAAIAGATTSTFTATANGSYAVVVTNTTGCKDTSACVMVSTVGLEDKQIDLGISLYPNPTGGDVYVTMPAAEQADITVFDAQGKVVSIMDNAQHGAVINLKDVQMGVYMVKVATAKGSNVFRIVKN